MDQKIADWIQTSKAWLDAGYLNKTVKGQWNDDWNKSMGSKSSVFAFLLPAWGIDFVLRPNWDGDMGAWALPILPRNTTGAAPMSTAVWALRSSGTSPCL